MDWRMFIHSFGPSFIGFLVFCLFHTGGSQDMFKLWLKKIFGDFFVEHYWRLSFCLLSWLLLYPAYLRMIFHSDPVFFQHWIELPLWVQILTSILRLSGVVILYFALLQFDYLEFLGFRQAWIGIQIMRGKAAKPIPIAGVDRLEIKGIYHCMRHPMLASAILTAIPRNLDFTEVINFFLILAYVLVGTIYEERQLILHFGPQYLQYKKDVGSYFPRLSTLAYIGKMIR